MHALALAANKLASPSTLCLEVPGFPLDLSHDAEGPVGFDRAHALPDRLGGQPFTAHFFEGRPNHLFLHLPWNDNDAFLVAKAS